MSQQAKLKKITIQAAESAFKNGDTQLYVKNRTGVEGSDASETGNINFTIRFDGNPVTVTAPVTWVPFDLSLYAPKDVILRDPNFRRIVSRGFLDVLDTTEANQFIESTPKAQAVLAKLLNAVKEDTNEDGVSSINQINPEAPQIDPDISIFIQNIVVRSSSEDSADIIAELEAKDDSIKDKELQYLVENSSNSELKEWSATMLDIRKQ